MAGEEPSSPAVSGGKHQRSPEEVSREESTKRRKHHHRSHRHRRSHRHGRHRKEEEDEVAKPVDGDLEEGEILDEGKEMKEGLEDGEESGEMKLDGSELDLSENLEASVDSDKMDYKSPTEDDSKEMDLDSEKTGSLENGHATQSKGDKIKSHKRKEKEDSHSDKRDSHQDDKREEEKVDKYSHSDKRDNHKGDKREEGKVDKYSHRSSKDDSYDEKVDKYSNRNSKDDSYHDKYDKYSRGRSKDRKDVKNHDLRDLIETHDKRERRGESRERGERERERRSSSVRARDDERRQKEVRDKRYDERESRGRERERERERSSSVRRRDDERDSRGRERERESSVRRRDDDRRERDMMDKRYNREREREGERNNSVRGRDRYRETERERYYRDERERTHGRERNYKDDKKNEEKKEKTIQEEEEEEDYESKIEQKLSQQEEEERIIEEARRRRQAILEKYKQKPQDNNNTTTIKEEEVKNENGAEVKSPIFEDNTEQDSSDGDGGADKAFALDKSPAQHTGLANEKAPGGAAGLGEGSPKSERSVDMFCDDIFGETPVKVGKVGKEDKMQIERSGLHDNWDDPEGYYSYRFGEVLDGRYEIIAAQGKGVFSTVVRAKDLKAGKNDPQEIAIKIIRNNETMYKAGMDELIILKKLAGADPDDRRHIVRFLSSFKYRNHLCLVFESLHMNLREVLKKFGRNIGLKLTAVRAYAKQLFVALKHLRNCGVLHCDIKPDNMLVNEAKNVLKLCDFGNAMFAGQNEITPYLVSRFYRAPEIILGLPYDHPLDIWSVGCCLYELYTGRVLFPGPSNNDMLRLHMELKGPFPKKMLKKAAFIDRHFDQDLNFHASEEDPVTKKTIKRLMANIKPKDIGNLMTSFPGEEAKLVANFKDLLERIFVLDPDKRMTVSQALSHPFITGK
ncbi:hypothetical protein LUZ60_006273 [Juncus effusus]|nr:hypothetical protein LUZ60_006273 [Juncus effusus]